jgi:hypothetical protein
VKPPGTGIAIASTDSRRWQSLPERESSEITPNPSTSSVSKNPCLTDNNEDEILKILK